MGPTQPGIIPKDRSKNKPRKLMGVEPHHQHHTNPKLLEDQLLGYSEWPACAGGY